TINQQVAPGSVQSQGRGWGDLGGPYTVTSGTLTVRLGGQAGWLVIADAVRVQELTPPTAAIVDVAPDPRIDGISALSITFGEPVVGFDLADLRFTRDGGANLLTAAQTLTTTDGVTWTLGNVMGLTGTPGTYTLSLVAAGSGITDRA